MNLESYVAKAKEANHLTSEEESNASINQLVEAHLMLAVKVAFKYKHFNVDVDDLIQAANEGLFKAAKKFEHGKARFSTIAYKYCVYECCEFLMRNTGVVPVGTSSKNKKIFLNAEGKTDEQLAKDNNETVDYVSFIGLLKYGMRSDSSDDNLHRMIGYDDKLADEEAICKIKGCISKLSDTEQVVMTKRYLEDNDLTLNDIGKDFGVTGSRVFQIEKSAIKKLREMIC